jgi:hypothetical protein
MSAARLPDEPGVASARAFDGGGIISLTHDWQTIVSRQITVPGPGYVVALGSAWIDYDHAYGDYDAVQIGTSDVTDAVGPTRVTTFGTSANVGSGSYDATLTPHAILDVAAAGTYEYYLLGKKFWNVGANVLNAELILLYVPTAYGTVSAAKGETVTTSEMETIFKRGANAAVPDSARIDYGAELRALRSEVEALRREVKEKK